MGILKLFDLIDYSKIDFMHSVSKGKSPKSFSETWGGIQDAEESFYLNLRNYLDFKVPFPRLHFSERLPLHSFPKAWNDQIDNWVKSISNGIKKFIYRQTSSYSATYECLLQRLL